MTSRRHDKAFRAASLAAGAAVFGAAELALALLVGGFFAWGRSEALLFFAFRPWLLLAAALFVARIGWRKRAGFYALALLSAGLAESLFLASLGGDPWTEMVRGWAAGAAMAFVLDLIVQTGRRAAGAMGQIGGAIAAALLLIVPGATAPYEQLALGPTGSRLPAQRPDLLLMTGLPLVWGETGPFDPASRPAAAWTALLEEFEIRPIDYLDAAAIGDSRLMLLAQPRLLAPGELAMLDDWVHGGGHVLILADPSLVWPSRLPLGDVRRPPVESLLGPLLSHWDLRLGQPGDARLVVHDVISGGHIRRLATIAPGRFAKDAGVCRLELDGLLASCGIGRGAALLVADADLLHDVLWAAPGPSGSARHRRLSDNPLIVADWLDRLAGIERQRAARPVRWRDRSASRVRALLLAAIPLLGLLAAAIHGLIHNRRAKNARRTQT